MRVFERLLAEEPAWSELLAEVERELQPAPNGQPVQAEDLDPRRSR
jgi:hypothetical protein